MKELLLIIFFLCSMTHTFSQGNVILSQENANEKGVTPIWPKCDRSRRTPMKCFDNKLRDHITRTFIYPQAAVKKALSGTVTVDFLINKKGKVEILEFSGGHPLLQKEAVRIIKAIPKMKPASWGKKPIAVAYSIPITFRKPL